MPTQSPAALKTTLDLAKIFFEAKSRHDIDGATAIFAPTANYICSLPVSGEQKDWFSADLYAVSAE